MTMSRISNTKKYLLSCQRRITSRGGYMRPVTRVCLFILSLLLAGCTPTTQVEPAPAYAPRAALIDPEQPDRFWWQLRFRLAWPEGEEADFSRHLLIAEQLLLPVIVEHQEQLPLWRFHRRAGRDATGHQFSLIFFSDKSTAEKVHAEITSAPITQWLIDRQLLEETRFDQRSPQELGRLELTSDPSWPLEIQRSWPHFIMGTSQAWLMQVQELSAQNALVGEVEYPAMLLHYQDVDARLNAQWREFGQHAYLHHLNAVFGYQPLVIRSSEVRAF